MLAAQLQGEVNIAAINVTSPANPEIKERFNIYGFPSLRIFDHDVSWLVLGVCGGTGRQLNRETGSTNSNELPPPVSCTCFA